MKRLSIHICGLVQGVGFRPFVYTIALRYNLVGFVLNNSKGVFIEAQGDEKSLESFLKSLKEDLPPLAQIDTFEYTYIDLKNESTFSITKSLDDDVKFAPIVPDMALCEDCLKELRDKKNRRYLYPFINCTNCGPRYSIIKDIPYDRPKTSMAKFKMCKKCQSEYENPLDRRYHAQPISCHECGVKLSFVQNKTRVDGGIEDTAKLINDGHIVAIKGVGGFHLVCDATNPKPVKKLREFKAREVKPFAVMCKDLDSALKHVEANKDEQEALGSIEKPIVLLQKKQNLQICKEVAPQTDRLGVFLPNTPLHVLLFDYLKAPIIATSANKKSSPIITDFDKLDESFGELLAGVLDYDRDIVHPCDDSVLQLIGNKKLFLRLSRAYMPLSFPIANECDKTILCVGAEQKNQLCIYFKNRLIVSPYLGDMDNVDSYGLFVKTIEDLKRFYGLTFDLIVHDKHPSYATTLWAKEQSIATLDVQHHHAHILSVLVDVKLPLQTEVLGVAWDGTGYGADKTIWGGEFLKVKGKECERVAYFKPFKLLGGDKSIKNINRIVYSMLLNTKVSLDELEEFDELKPLKQMHEKNLNSPLCSSVGRLFDAVCYLATGLQEVSYDGQSGLLLESLYDENITHSYTFRVDEGVINYDEMLLQILKERDNPSLIASKFLNTLCDIILEISSKYELPLVLSGGVFQNKTLLQLLLKKSSKKVYFPQNFTPNDGGICVGQLSFALA